MPRVARIIAKDYPYHVTQRVNYRQTAFKTDTDYQQYLAWLKENIKQGRTELTNWNRENKS